MTDSSTLKTTLKLDQLAQFIGTERLFRHALNPRLRFTDGIKYVADHAGAYWLLDEIALAQRSEQVLSNAPFQHWKLEVEPLNRAMLICEDGDGLELYRRRIRYTDFPAPGVTLYVGDQVLMLPSEY